MSRHFHGLIFFGNTDCRKQMSHLQCRLEDAASIMSGLQQGGEKSMVIADKSVDMEQELEDCVRDIAAALTGKNIEFKEELPYPPRIQNGCPIGE